MPKYDVYSEKEARELLRYLPADTRLEVQTRFGNLYLLANSKADFDHRYHEQAIAAMATHESNGHLPPGSTAAIAGMVDGDHEKVVTDIGCCGSGTIVRPPRYGEKPTHILIEVSK